MSHIHLYMWVSILNVYAIVHTFCYCLTGDIYHECVSVRLSVCMCYVCIYICVYVCMCVYIYI